jgi:choline dehydrogenase-like flavoprotein
MGVPVHQVKEFAPRLSFGGSISSPGYLALALSDHPAYLREVDTRWRHMAVYYAMITSPREGRVRCLPGFSDPLVTYSLGKEDRRLLAEGLFKLTQLMFAAGACAVFPGISQFGPPLRAGAESRLPAELPARLANLMTIHLFSSCPMGENLARCAANSFGRLLDVPNLYLADASLLCTAPGVNPQGSVMALARRNALKFLGKI